MQPPSPAEVPTLTADMPDPDLEEELLHPLTPQLAESAAALGRIEEAREAVTAAPPSPQPRDWETSLGLFARYSERVAFKAPSAAFQPKGPPTRREGNGQAASAAASRSSPASAQAPPPQ